jgi:type I restriction enzyme, R subunit
MSEFKNVEEPFLAKLKEIGWEVITHPEGIPHDPTHSYRSDFKQVTLQAVFMECLLQINPWLTPQQAVEVYQEITELERTTIRLLEANKSVFEKLVNKTKVTVAENELTKEKDPIVKLIDFENYENNRFIAINQFRIDTLNSTRNSIIPDIVLFVNGLPLVVVECKDVSITDPLSSAVDQILRYANKREALIEEDGDSLVKKTSYEGCEELFHYNLFNIATHGEEARFGTITGDFEYYLNWKDIFPEKYKQTELYSYVADEEFRYSANGLHKSPEVRQEVLILGMLNHEIVLDVLKHFTVFRDDKVKIVCRYQQYRAVGKIMERLSSGKTAAERSGVVWHTQGSGKSLTMIFLIRKLRSQPDLKDYKVLITVDRINLEKQLSEDAVLTEEFKEANVVSARSQVIEKLSGRESNLNMVMIHKFIEEEIKHSETLRRAYEEEGQIPVYKSLGVVNESERILILIDEAHRTQSGDMSSNLFNAFPNSTKIAFTGTPLLTERHKQKTHERFGGHKSFIDTYKIREAVKDKATLDLVYIGKTSKDHITQKKALDSAFEDVFKDRTQKEKEMIQKKYGTMQAYLENTDRIKKIAYDLVDHYLQDIYPNGFKAMVVASSVLSAVKYELLIEQAIQDKINDENAKEAPDLKRIEELKFLKVATIVTMQENNEAQEVTNARKKAKDLKAVENFKKDFNFDRDDNGEYVAPNSGIAILCVCDMLLTGFDAPIAQVMYLDKKLKEHDLLQAIARVNRTKKDKEHGLLVDYFGVANHLREALNIWGCEEEEDIKDLLAYFKDLDSEIPILESRYNRVIQLFQNKGILGFRLFVEQKITDAAHEQKLVEDCIDLAKSVSFRAQFDTYLKAFFDSLDLLYSTQAAREYLIPSKRLGQLLMRIRNRYRDPSLDLKWAKPKVRKLIDQYLKSMGIDSTVAPVSLYSKEFTKEVKSLGSNSKAKASEMEHAIRRHIKVNMQKDPALYKRFLTRMESILKKFQENWTEQIDAFTTLREDMAKGRTNNQVSGLNAQQSPFYELVMELLYADSPMSPDQEDTLKKLIVEIVNLLQEALDKPDYWNRNSEIKNLRGKVKNAMLYSGLVTAKEDRERIATEILHLAKNRNEELLGS